MSDNMNVSLTFLNDQTIMKQIVPSSEVDRDRQCESVLVPGKSQRQNVSPGSTPSVPIHPVSPDPPRLTVDAFVTFLIYMTYGLCKSLTLP